MSVFRSIVSLANKRCLGIGNWQRLLSQQAAAIARKESQEKENNDKPLSQLAEYRFIYPEFLPDPKFEFRNKIREKLEREDMLKRRTVIDIPEFYVGSILGVTASDPYAPTKQNYFMGICIGRTYCGLRATFTLRNVVDKQGVEIMYDMYNPTLLSIEVLRLEKRLDDHLYYLRDAAPEYSTFPFDMEPEFIIEGEPVRLNPIKVKLNPPPWFAKWEQRDLKGIEPIEAPSAKRKKILHKKIKPMQVLDHYDIMKQYRRTIPEEDQQEIWEDVDKLKVQFPVRKQTWKKALQKAKPRTRSLDS